MEKKLSLRVVTREDFLGSSVGVIFLRGKCYPTIRVNSHPSNFLLMVEMENNENSARNSMPLIPY